MSCYSTTRLAETCRIALAFIRNNMPFELSGADVIRKKLLSLDNIGVVPSWHSLHRANQSFIEGLDVHDCIHISELKPKERNRILPYISWLPLKVQLPPLPFK